MGSYEYKVITAPTRGARGPGVKGAEGRFAHSLEQAINQFAAEGWEYQRAETLPSEERSGLSSTQTVYRSILIFRRRKAGDLTAYDPRMLDGPNPRPLLLPTPDTDNEPVAADQDQGPDHGLNALLRRRAARLFPSGTPDPAVQPGFAEGQVPFDRQKPLGAEKKLNGFNGHFAGRKDDLEYYEDDVLEEDEMSATFYGSDTLEFSDHRAKFSQDESTQIPQQSEEKSIA